MSLKSNGSDNFGKSWITISLCESFTTPKTPISRTLTLRDLSPRVPAVINGFDPIGKLWITIPTESSLLSPETLMLQTSTRQDPLPCVLADGCVLTDGWDNRKELLQNSLANTKYTSKGWIRNEDQYKQIWMPNSPAKECHTPIEGWNPQ